MYIYLILVRRKSWGAFELNIYERSYFKIVSCYWKLAKGISRRLRKPWEVSFCLAEKISNRDLRIPGITFALFWAFFHKLGMKIKRFQTNFLKIDLLVAEINRSTFSIMSKKWSQRFFYSRSAYLDSITIGSYIVNCAVFNGNLKIWNFRK